MKVEEKYLFIGLTIKIQTAHLDYVLITVIPGRTTDSPGEGIMKHGCKRLAQLVWLVYQFDFSSTIGQYHHGELRRLIRRLSRED